MALEMRPIKHWQSEPGWQSWDFRPEPSLVVVGKAGRAPGEGPEPWHDGYFPSSGAAGGPPVSLYTDAMTTQNEQKNY